MGDSNPQSDESNIDEGWEDEPEAVPRPATAAPVPVVNAWGPVPASRPDASDISPGNAVGVGVAPVVARPPVPAAPLPPAPVERPAPESEIAPASKKAKIGRGSKDARAAKAAKKAAKKAARQAERKARAKNNNKAAIRGSMTATRGHADPAYEPMTARAEGRKIASFSPSEMGQRASTSQRRAKASAGSSVRPSGGMWARSTPLLVLIAAVAVLAGLGWFLAGRH